MNNEFQEINLLNIVSNVIRMWWLVALLMVVGGVSALFVTNNYMAETYVASTTLFIGKDTDVLSGISMSDLQIDNKLVLDYRELIKTKLVTREVIAALDLDTSYEEMILKLDVDTLSDSRFVSITYVDYDPLQAQTVVNKLSETLVIKAQDIVGVDNIQIVDFADEPQYPDGPNVRINVLMAAVIGFLIALLIILVLSKLDNRIKTKKDIERFIGLTVLSEIPKFKGR